MEQSTRLMVSTTKAIGCQLFAKNFLGNRMGLPGGKTQEAFVKKILLTSIFFEFCQGRGEENSPRPFFQDFNI